MVNFKLGQIVATPGAMELFRQASVNPAALLHRHSSGDWGDVETHDAAANDRAVREGGRILSVYRVGDEPVWVITEADRSVTTFLLPSEY